jgi:transposase
LSHEKRLYTSDMTDKQWQVIKPLLPLEQEGLPHPSTYKYRFGSWNKALEAAGLTPRRRLGG